MSPLKLSLSAMPHQGSRHTKGQPGLAGAHRPKASACGHETESTFRPCLSNRMSTLDDEGIVGKGPIRNRQKTILDGQGFRGLERMAEAVDQVMVQGGRKHLSFPVQALDVTMDLIGRIKIGQEEGRMRSYLKVHRPITAVDHSPLAGQDVTIGLISGGQVERERIIRATFGGIQDITSILTSGAKLEVRIPREPMLFHGIFLPRIPAACHGPPSPQSGRESAPAGPRRQDPPAKDIHAPPSADCSAPRHGD